MGLLPKRALRLPRGAPHHPRMVVIFRRGRMGYVVHICVPFQVSRHVSVLHDGVCPLDLVLPLLTGQTKSEYASDPVLVVICGVQRSIVLPSLCVAGVHVTTLAFHSTGGLWVPGTLPEGSWVLRGVQFIGDRAAIGRASLARGERGKRARM
jgi:hypothetical protein